MQDASIGREGARVEVIDGRSNGGLLARGVTWPGRRPHLDLLDVGTGQSRSEPLPDNRLGLRVLAAGPFCLGYSGPVDGVLTRVDCPRAALATSGRQCEECVAKDEFRLAHHAHLGGYVPDALAGYLAQPHWVYVATFADATSKVGTASDPRMTSRLDDQGAVRATYVARAADGRLARVLEDAVTERAGIAQTKRRSAKVAALERPLPTEQIRAEHDDAVGQARSALGDQLGRSGAVATKQAWDPPPTVDGFFRGVPTGGWLGYPHPLDAGDHGFRIEAVTGSTLLARLRDDAAAAKYVVDLGALTGCRIALGAYDSPNTPEQLSLF